MEIDYVDDEIVKVLDNIKKTRNAIGLNVYSESNENKVNISFNKNVSYGKKNDENDNQNESKKNEGRYNDDIIDDLADYSSKNRDN